ncbi:MAG: hypothetical protein P4L31_06435 [Candidatus Babeliales bacterium]|nr:hypothetical protein [Candidatus Babeliales bacterium]
MKKILLTTCLSINFITQINAHKHAEIALQTIDDVTLTAQVINRKESSKRFLIDLTGSIFLSNIYPITFSIENKSDKALKVSTNRIRIQDATVLTQKELASQISSQTAPMLIFSTILFPLFPLAMFCSYKKAKLESLEPIVAYFSPDGEITINPHATFSSTLFVQVESKKNDEGKYESYTPTHFQITIPIKDGGSWNLPLFTKDAFVFNIAASNAVNIN